MHDQFYLILPSNSSMKYYPKNTTTCFTTQLPYEIALQGRWGVALTEIHIPCSLIHLEPSEASIGCTVCGNRVVEIHPRFEYASIPCGIYRDHHQILEELSKIKGLQKAKIRLLASPERHGYVRIESSPDKECAKDMFKQNLNMSEKLKRILGFEGGRNEITPGNIEFIRGLVSTASRPACIHRALPDQLFVYTDICEPYIVGDVQASLLRIVNMDYTRYTYGTTQVKYFSPPNYIPLLNNNISTINIDVRDQLGKTIPFEYGTLTVTLHFKRIH